MQSIYRKVLSKLLSKFWVIRVLSDLVQTGAIYFNLVFQRYIPHKGK
jgi:hypothetical protein